MPSQPSTNRPNLRYALAAEPHESGNFVLYDPLGIGKAVVLSTLALEVAERFSGKHTIGAIAERIKTEFPQAEVTADAVAGLAAALDGALLLDSPRLRELVGGRVRKSICFNASTDPDKLREQLATLFTAPGGAGLPGERPGSPRAS